MKPTTRNSDGKHGCRVTSGAWQRGTSPIQAGWKCFDANPPVSLRARSFSSAWTRLAAASATVFFIKHKREQRRNLVAPYSCAARVLYFPFHAICTFLIWLFHISYQEFHSHAADVLVCCHGSAASALACSNQRICLFLAVRSESVPGRASVFYGRERQII